MAVQIVPGSENAVAIDLISTHIRRQLKDRCVHLRPKITRGFSGHTQEFDAPDRDTNWLNITLLENRPQLNVLG